MSTERGILREIMALRRRRVAETRARRTMESLEQAASRRADHRDFAAAISQGGLAVIAEMKKASPSAGLLRPSYDCADIAGRYARAGASAISVLTEVDFFRGSLEDLETARAHSSLPVLRKDFILDEYQVTESAASGADALLLIVAALSDRELPELIRAAARFQIAALVEVHDSSELDRALGAGARLIGVNNRNLKTLEVDLNVSLRLRDKIPAGCVAVSESGIRASGDLQQLARAGFDAVLIGEHFMRAADPGCALSELLMGVRNESSPDGRRLEAQPGAVE